MNVLSLFSGIGGIDLGLQRAGMTIAGQVEIDPWCRKILAKHWPEVPRHDDVRTAAEWWGGRPVAVVAGGFPCQPVSVAGRGKAQADSRWLWPAFAGVVRDLRPRFVVVENVPGLLRRGMGDVLGDLASLGYDAEWDCVPAVFVGAPHIRNQVFLVAYPSDDGPRRRQQQSEGSEGAWDVADADRAGLGERRRPEPVRAEHAAAQRSSETLADTGRVGRREGPRIFRRMGTQECGWWVTEPDVGRVAHGIPRRVDRLRGLGNAVVPQVAEHIGRLIMRAERGAA